MKRLFLRLLVVSTVVFQAGPAWAQESSGVDGKLLAEQSPIVPWLVGVGILAGTLAIAFKHPGRTHLD